MSLNGGSSVISIFISTDHLPPTTDAGFSLSQFSNCLFTLPVSGLWGLFVGLEPDARLNFGVNFMTHNLV
jgi:hypothetical protein